MRAFHLAALCLTVLAAPAAAAAASAAAQGADSIADRLVNDPRVEALRPYGQRIAPEVRRDRDVQSGWAMRVRLTGSPEFWRVGITSPVLRPVRAGDRIVIAFWARANRTENGAPGRIGRVQLEATPVIRTVFEKSFEVTPEWQMYQMEGVADRDYPAGGLNAAMHLDSAKQVLDIGPLYVLNYGQRAN